MAVVINTVTSTDKLSLINANFSTLAAAINDSLLWRNGSTAGETLLTRDMDFNGKSILNAYVGGAALSSLVSDVQEQVDVAEGFADAAQISATSAAESAASAAASVEQAQFVVDSAENQLLYYLTPQMFGAKGDYDIASNTGTDDTQAFKDCIAYGIANNILEVRVPCGNYLITDELNLGGVDYSGNVGVNMIGADMLSCMIFFKAPTATTPCISSVGGSGIHTSRGLSNIALRAHPDTVGSGYGLQLKGACFFQLENFLIWNFAVGLHLYNASASGVYTEFNKFRFGRLHFNRTANILFEVNGGDNSFHGNDFIGIQNQVYTGAAGVKVLGTTTPAYLYNQNWQMNFFGGTSCYAFDLTACNTDNLWGNLTHEGALILRTNDASSRFEFKGNFSGIGSLSYSINTVPTGVLSSFVFSNSFSNTSAFTNTNLSSYTPAPYNPQMADTTDNGVAAALYRLSNSSGYGVGINAQAGSPGFWLTATNTGSTLQGVSPRYRFGVDGNSLTAFTTTFFLGPSDSSYGMQLSSDTACWAPRTDSLMNLGTTSFRWLSLRTAGWNLTSTGFIPSTVGTAAIGSSSNYPANIYSQNAVTVVSDVNYKTNVKTLSEEDEFKALIQAVGSVPFKSWQLKSAVALKGEDSARWHVGVIAQEVKEAITNAGLDWTRYGVVTYEEVSQVVTQDEAGNYFPVVSEEEVSLLPVNSEGYITPIDGADTTSVSDDGTITYTRQTYMLRMEEFHSLRSAYLEAKLEALNG